MLPWMQSVQNKFCQWPCWLNISRCENCPPSEAKNGGFNLPKTPGSVPSAAPSAPTNTNYQRTGAQKWECYHLGDFIERNKLHQNLHLRFCDTFSRILLPANASFDVFLGHLVPHSNIPSTSCCQCSNLSTATTQAAQQNQPLWEAGDSSSSMLGFTSSRTLASCPGTGSSCIESLASWKYMAQWEYTFENQQQDFEQRKTYELHSEEHHHEFGKRPLAETQKMHSGRFIANLQGQMVALTFWFWLLYRVQIGRCLNLESLQTHSLTSSYRGIKKLNTCNKLW